MGVVGLGWEGLADGRGRLRRAREPLPPDVAAGSPVAGPGQPQTVLGEPRLPESALTEGITLDRLNTRRGVPGRHPHCLVAGDPGRLPGGQPLPCAQAGARQ